MSWCGFKAACGLTIAVGVALYPSESNACSCAGDSTLLWPGPSDVVTLDTTLVVGHLGEAFEYVRLPEGDAGADSSDAGDVFAVGLVLRSEHGDWVELAPVRQVENTALCTGNIFIVEPVEELAADTEYTLLDSADEVATFRTGSQVAPEISRDAGFDSLEWSVLGSSEDPSLIVSVFISGVPENPFLVSWRGHVKEARLVRSGTPGFESEVYTADIGGVECPEVELVGVDGETLDSRILCEAQRCTNSMIVSGSTCGENPAADVSYDEFLELPMDCGVEAALPPPSVNEVDVGSDPDSGCSFAPRANGSALHGVTWLLLGIAAAVSRRSRRPSRANGEPQRVAGHVEDDQRAWGPEFGA